MDLMLKRMRNRAGLSQAEAAAALGVKLRTYGSWERGEVQLSVPQAVECANLFGCTLGALAGEPETAPDPDEARVRVAMGSMNQAGRARLADVAEAMARSGMWPIGG